MRKIAREFRRPLSPIEGQRLQVAGPSASLKGCTATAISALAILLCQTGSLPAQATHNISLDSVQGLHNVDSIYSSQQIVFFLRITSLTESTHSTISTWNGFQLYSPTGATWSSAGGAYTDAITFDMQNERSVLLKDVDGTDVDTVHFYSGGGCGLPPDFDEVSLTVSIGPIDTLYAGHTICLDSVRVIRTPTWFWDLGICDVVYGTVMPEWLGPHCFTVTNPPCPISRTGDVNTDDVLSSSDIIQVVNYVFKGGAIPQPCPASADVNCNGLATSGDIVFLVNHVFKGGPVPCNVCALIWNGTWNCP